MLIAHSPEMQQLLAMAREFARGRGPIILIGPTGTGKGELARYIHEVSRRAAAPFVVANGPELANDLGGSTLFGHLRGAFTGAVSDRKGLIARAASGTVFIDEFHLMPLATQALFLRLLQERRWVMVGSDTEQVVACRFIITMQLHPDTMVAQGLLLPDLRFRFGELALEVPGLASHPADIPYLAAHFLELERPHLERGGAEGARDIAPDALAALVRAAWPGNIRELAKVIEYASLRASGHPGRLVTREDLPGRFQETVGEFSPAERRIVVGWYFRPEAGRHFTRTEVAVALGVSPGTIDNDRRALPCPAAASGLAEDLLPSLSA